MVKRNLTVISNDLSLLGMNTLPFESRTPITFFPDFAEKGRLNVVEAWGQGYNAASSLNERAF
jgi:hypothetical protein